MIGGEGKERKSWRALIGSRGNGEIRKIWKIARLRLGTAVHLLYGCSVARYTPGTYVAHRIAVYVPPMAAGSWYSR